MITPRDPVPILNDILDHLRNRRVGRQAVEEPKSNFWLNPRSECQKPLPAEEIALCLSEIKHAHTDDGVRQEMACAQCDQRHSVRGIGASLLTERCVRASLYNDV